MFKRSEDSHRGADAMHGAGGEWRVERQRLSWEILEAFREAMVQAGIPRTDDFNCGDNHGAGFFEVNQRRGVRWRAAKGFLEPVMHRPDLTVVTDALVARVRFDGRRATGIALVRGGATEIATARIETILAAGARRGRSPSRTRCADAGARRALRPARARPGPGDRRR